MVDRLRKQIYFIVQTNFQCTVSDPTAYKKSTIQSQRIRIALRKPRAKQKIPQISNGCFVDSETLNSFSKYRIYVLIK